MRGGVCLVAAVLAVAGASVEAATTRAKPALATTCGRLSDHQPVWSPRGRRIAFTREITGPRFSSAVFRIDADGRRLIRVSPVAYDDASYPSWSPDATHVAFEQFGLDAVVHLVVVTALGRDPIVVASFPWMREPPDPQFAWHPGGSRLAFSREGGIYVARTDGSGAERLVNGTRPAWSLEGGRLAFITADNRIGIVHSDGSDFSAFGDRVASPPRWSPDGKSLAYTYATGNSSSAVAVVDVVSASSRTVATSAAAPVWSPSGRRLVVSNGYDSKARRGLRVVDLRNGRVTPLTHDASPRFGADDFAPSWSFDGRTIVFTSANLGSRGATMVGSELRLVDPDGGHERRLTYHCTTGAGGGRVNAINGSWLPDLVYGSPRRDAIDAGPGDDTVQARDRIGDAIRCGAGRDVVLANRGDRVARDCEVVRYAPSTGRAGT